MDRKRVEFTSRLSKGQAIAALLYLPVHVVLLPLLAVILMLRGVLNETEANLLCYAVGVAYMLVFLWKFFRRDFDALCDRPLRCLLEIAVSYGIMWCCNLFINMLLYRLNEVSNPNNEALFNLAGMEYGQMAAMAVFMAPVVEESIFRAGLFGVLRRRSRTLAYIVSVLLFSAYHVWSYALADLKNLIYIVQYIPVSILLCRCYERTNSIWGSIFLHMLVNGVSVAVMYTML